ncbi:MAG: trypsin [Cereibacter sphaeroides]|uniref:Trypsin n=1 Tax=Cereibacter sphaeroides TaxID=1063 RepID=A0A2W5S6N8_CERSP|nr:MAG: trypsin [Cereibacter sphaeroides]
MTAVWKLALATFLIAAPVLADTGLDRLTRRDQSFGWEAVGRVDIGDKAFCTGTLIATDLVLTAAHCVYDGSTGQPEDVSTMRFRAGLSDGVSIAEVAVARAVAHPGYDPQEQTGKNSIGHDLALLQLAEPIPAAVASPFVVQSPGSAGEVSVVSYARGREDALSWQRSCRVLGRQQGLLAFNCDVDFGSSGAPVFDRSGNRARIVSIISAGRKDAEGTIAFGMELPSLLADLKTALRSGRGVIEAPKAAPTIRRIGQSGGTRDISARFVKP